MAEKKPKLKHRSEYALARLLERGVSTLPEGAALGVGRAVGALVRSPLGIRRETVEGNLRRAFPDADDAWIAETTRRAFRHLGQEAAAILRLSRMDPAAIVERTRVTGWDELEAAMAEGRGVILATGHLGNWEIAAAAVAARGHPIAAVVKRMANPLVDARLDAIRRRLGVETIDMARAATRIPRALAAGHAVGIVYDQDARSSGVWVPFFGHPASTHRGPALFALRLNAPLFAASVWRLPDGTYDVRGERIPAERTGDLEADVLRVTNALSQHLEAAVRHAPEQYFWFHKRWKTAPPAELHPGLLGTTRPPAEGQTPEQDTARRPPRPED